MEAEGPGFQIEPEQIKKKPRPGYQESVLWQAIMGEPTDQPAEGLEKLESWSPPVRRSLDYMQKGAAPPLAIGQGIREMGQTMEDVTPYSKMLEKQSGKKLSDTEALGVDLGVGLLEPGPPAGEFLKAMGVIFSPKMLKRIMKGRKTLQGEAAVTPKGAKQLEKAQSATELEKGEKTFQKLAKAEEEFVFDPERIEWIENRFMEMDEAESLMIRELRKANPAPGTREKLYDLKAQRAELEGELKRFKLDEQYKPYVEGRRMKAVKGKVEALDEEMSDWERMYNEAPNQLKADQAWEAMTELKGKLAKKLSEGYGFKIPKEILEVRRLDHEIQDVWENLNKFRDYDFRNTMKRLGPSTSMEPIAEIWVGPNKHLIRSAADQKMVEELLEARKLGLQRKLNERFEDVRRLYDPENLPAAEKLDPDFAEAAVRNLPDDVAGHMAEMEFGVQDIKNNLIPENSPAYRYMHDRKIDPSEINNDELVRQMDKLPVNSNAYYYYLDPEVEEAALDWYGSEGMEGADLNNIIDAFMRYHDLNWRDVINPDVVNYLAQKPGKLRTNKVAKQFEGIEHSREINEVMRDIDHWKHYSKGDFEFLDADKMSKAGYKFDKDPLTWAKENGQRLKDFQRIKDKDELIEALERVDDEIHYHIKGIIGEGPDDHVEKVQKEAWKKVNEYRKELIERFNFDPWKADEKLFKETSENLKARISGMMDREEFPPKTSMVMSKSYGEIKALREKLVQIFFDENSPYYSSHESFLKQLDEMLKKKRPENLAKAVAEEKALPLESPVKPKNIAKPIEEATEKSPGDVLQKVMEKQTNLGKKAAEEFGLTDSIEEAGYILDDGKMLDFSGKAEGGPAGVRYMDHRQIERIHDAGYDQGEVMGTRSLNMYDYMNKTGALRVSDNGNSISINFTKPLTRKQMQMLKIHGKGKEIVVDVSKPNGDVIKTRAFSNFADFEASGLADFTGTEALRKALEEMKKK